MAKTCPDKDGVALAPGPSVQDILDRDTRPVPPALREERFQDLGSEDVPVERYTDRAFFDLEMARMWPRVWQMACREEEIPAVGDHVLYEIGDWSWIVMRTAPETVRAYANACLHRGRALRLTGGHVDRLRCPFHGFTWSLDGTIRDVPCRWDFPHLRDEHLRLPEAAVDTWGGFVFLRMSEDGPSLADYLGALPAHFEAWDLASRWKAAHVGQVVDVNWKACAEAFLESFHVKATHPQIMTTTADINTQYDVDSRENPFVNRMITPFGVPSPWLGEVAEERILAEFTGSQGEGAELPPGATARQVLAEKSREIFGRMSGRDFSGTSDAEMLDAIQYFVFPNFFPWGGASQNIVYRFRPEKDDPGRTFMEVMLLLPAPREGERPAPAKLRMLEPGQKWTDAPELGPLGAVFNQDMANLPWLQKGMRALRGRRGLKLARYQESRIRQLHHTLMRFVEGDLGPEAS